MGVGGVELIGIREGTGEAETGLLIVRSICRGAGEGTEPREERLC